MFKTNLKIAWRNLIKDRQFTALNIIGLSVGLACAFLIYLWVNDELSFDKSFENDAQLYQLMEQWGKGPSARFSDESVGPLSETIAQQFPEVAYASPLAPPGWFQASTLSVGDRVIKANGQYAGKDYFNIFSFKLLEGRKDRLLADKNAIVISDELANKLFGTTENIIGKPLKYQQQKIFFVSGVFERTPYHSSQQFDFVMSFDYLKEVQDWVTSWNNLGPHNFVLLRKGTDINAFNKKIAGVIAANNGDTSRRAVAKRFSDLYLNNNFGSSDAGATRMDYVRLFSLIAVFILVIAAINFMNLSTAKSARRMKEVGIKKVVGAARGQLIFQFIAESVLLSMLAMLIAGFITWSLLPSFNQLTAKQIVLHADARLIGSILGISLMTGLLAGSYPAFYLSKFNPIAILKGKLNLSITQLFLRKGLVVFQFTLSAIMIVAVVVVYQQIRFIESADPGYNKENVIRISSDGRITGTEATFAEELRKIPGIINASYTHHSMVGHTFGHYGIDWDGKDPNQSVFFEAFEGGYDLIETLGMHIIYGRSFSRAYTSDSSSIILNEAAVKAIGLKNPVGKTIRLYDKPVQIVGIVKDFHFESLHLAVKPSYIVVRPNIGGSMIARVKAGRVKETIAAVQHLYRSYNPGFPFTFSFLDESYQRQYETETRVGVLSRYFAGLAILISCLGLFGLAAFTAQRRQKEIGIRKVIGASAASITGMLSKDFLVLVLTSLLIAFPIAGWLMSNWLQSYAYRIHIGPAVFVVTAVFVVVLTLVTIGFQSIRAALANPVKSLHTE